MTVRKIDEAIRAANKITVAAHTRADGDAVGSVIGLGLALKALGKDVTMVLPDGVPQAYAFLDGKEQVHYNPPKDAGLLIALDCSDPDRLGEKFAGAQVDINIDHHVTNTGFAVINHVVPEMPATAMVLAQLLFDWGYPMPQAALDALMTGLLADTLGFRTNNMSPDTFRMAARLMEAGARLTELYQATLLARSYNATAYWGQGLSRLQRLDGLIWTKLTLEDRQLAGYHGNDDADLINVLSSINEMQIVLLFVEQKNERVKMSWRAKKGIDVSRLALQYGGGGHPGAAGAEVSGKLEEIIPGVVETTLEFLTNLNQVEKSPSD